MQQQHKDDRFQKFFICGMYVGPPIRVQLTREQRQEIRRQAKAALRRCDQDKATQQADANEQDNKAERERNAESFSALLGRELSQAKQRKRHQAAVAADCD